MLRSEIYISQCYSLFFVLYILFIFLNSQVFVFISYFNRSPSRNSLSIIDLMRKLKAISMTLLYIFFIFFSFTFLIFFFFYFWKSPFVDSSISLNCIAHAHLRYHFRFHRILVIMFSFLCYFCEIYFSISIQKLTSPFLYVNYYYFFCCFRFC